MDIPSNDKNLMAEIFSIVMDASPIAYVRPVATDMGTGYAVCSTDGTQLAVFSTRDEAFFAAKQHDLEPVLIH